MDDERDCSVGASGTRCIKEAFMSDSSYVAAVAAVPGAPCAMGCGAYGDDRLDGVCRHCFPKLYPDALSRLRVDHLVYVVPGALADACADFEARSGVRPQLGGRHDGLGTHNALVGLGGGRYLELLCRDPAQPDPPRTWMAIDSISDAPRLVTWAALRSDLDRAVTAARKAGYDPGTPRRFRRQTPSGSEVRWALSCSHYSEPLPGDGAVPFLIWWDSDTPAAAAPQGCTLISLHAETNQPHGLAPMLEAVGLTAGEFVRTGEATRLVAVLDTPKGRLELS